MKRTLKALLLSLLVALPLAAVDEVNHLAATLAQLGKLPGVSGYEERVSQWLMQRLKEYDAEVDNLGNVTVTVGSGAPHRLLVTPIDEPGYVVSAITPDGYLRVQRLPQAGVHPWFDLLHSTQPVQILTRKGELVPGVVAGLSTHLHRDLGVDDRTDTPERLYIDVGASSAEEVRALGVDLLDPITLEKEVYPLARSQQTAPFLSERFGAAALVRLIEGMDASKLQGTLTVAFVTRRYMGNQGLDRLVREQAADEMIFIQRLEKSEAQLGAGALVATLEGSEPALAADRHCHVAEVVHIGVKLFQALHQPLADALLVAAHARERPQLRQRVRNVVDLVHCHQRQHDQQGKKEHRQSPLHG